MAGAGSRRGRRGTAGAFGQPCLGTYPRPVTWQSAVPPSEAAGSPMRSRPEPVLPSCAMADVLLFHHIQGLTTGVVEFADELRAAGHTVHTPDLYDGRTFDSIQDGAGLRAGRGRPRLRRAGRRDRAPGCRRAWSTRASPSASQAQRLAQTRPGATGALLFESCIPITGEWAFGPWPDGVPGPDPRQGRRRVLRPRGRHRRRPRDRRDRSTDAELFTYPGDQHLFADPSLASYDAEAAALLKSGCWSSWPASSVRDALRSCWRSTFDAHDPRRRRGASGPRCPRPGGRRRRRRGAAARVPTPRSGSGSSRAHGARPVRTGPAPPPDQRQPRRPGADGRRGSCGLGGRPPRRRASCRTRNTSCWPTRRATSSA